MESVLVDLSYGMMLLVGCTGIEIAAIVGATASVAGAAHSIARGGGRGGGGRGGGAPSAAPPPPSAEDPAVRARLDEERRQRGASGRASTLLADESLGVGSDIGSSTPDANKKLLGAGYF